MYFTFCDKLQVFMSNMFQICTKNSIDGEDGVWEKEEEKEKLVMVSEAQKAEEPGSSTTHTANWCAKN